MKNVSRMAIVIGLFLFLTSSYSCTFRQATLAAVSTRNLSLEKVDLDKMPRKQDIQGEDRRIMFFGIPFGMPTLQGAVEDALTKGDGDIVFDGVVEVGWWDILIVGEKWIQIKGKVANTKAIQGSGGAIK